MNPNIIIRPIGVVSWGATLLGLDPAPCLQVEFVFFIFLREEGGGGLLPIYGHLQGESIQSLLIQSGDNDYLMNETRRKSTTGRQSPSAPGCARRDTCCRPTLDTNHCFSN